jgi:hypothetical protein
MRRFHKRKFDKTSSQKFAESRTDRVGRVYYASDAAETVSLYKDLSAIEPYGKIAMNLLRTQKASARAKNYRG